MIPAARLLGPSTLGKVAVLVTLIPIFSDLIDFGGGTFVSRVIASHKFSSKDYKLYLTRKYINCIFLLVPWAAILLFLGVDFILIVPLTLLLVLSNMLNLFNTNMQQIAIAQGKVGNAAFGLFIERFGWACFAVFIFVGVDSLEAFSLATILGYFAQSAFHYFTIIRRIPKGAENQNAIAEIRLKSYSDIGLKTIISNMYLFNQIIVTVIAGTTAGGIFSAAYRLRNLLIVGYISASWSMTNDLLVNHSREEFKSSLLKNRQTIILNILGILALFIFAEDLFTKVFGIQYEQSIVVFRLLCVSQILSVFQILITTYLMCGYHEKSLRRMVSAIVPITLVFEVFGAMFDGARGAAIGTLLSSLATSFIYVRQFWKLSK